MGSEHSTVHVHTFAPPMGTEQALRVMSALQRQAGLHQEWVGSETRTPNTVLPASVADQATLLREIFQKWAAAASAPDATVHEQSHSSVPVSSLSIGNGGFLAAVQVGEDTIVVAQASECVPASSGMQAILETCMPSDSTTIEHPEMAAQTLSATAIDVRVSERLRGST